MKRRAQVTTRANNLINIKHKSGFFSRKSDVVGPIKFINGRMFMYRPISNNTQRLLWLVLATQCGFIFRTRWGSRKVCKVASRGRVNLYNEFILPVATWFPFCMSNSYIVVIFSIRIVNIANCSDPKPRFIKFVRIPFEPSLILGRSENRFSAHRCLLRHPCRRYIQHGSWQGVSFVALNNAGQQWNYSCLFGRNHNYVDCILTTPISWEIVRNFSHLPNYCHLPIGPT